MTIKSFLKLVEIQTKIASMIPFFAATFFVVYHKMNFKFENFIIMFVSVLAFDMFTTGFNNYFDNKRAIKKHGFNYEQHNAIVHYKLTQTAVITSLAILLCISTIFGVWLFLRTDYILLVLGVLAFGTGIFYSFGPIPISRTPFGEIFSGGFMGFVIPFIAIYVHIFDQNLFSFFIESGVFKFSIDIEFILRIVIFCIPYFAGIANIMLANNICDIEDDIENKRYTLPVYIGKKASLVIFAVLANIGFIAIITAVIFNVAPGYSLLVLLTAIPVNMNLKAFFAKQHKGETFVFAVKNFILTGGSYMLVFGISATLSLF